MREYYDIVVVGGGPAGLAAAISAFECGIKDVLILDRDEKLGGILNQCIHNGFGLHTFKEELTGPEYAERYIKQVKELGIAYCLDTTVLEISKDRVITCVNPRDGFITIHAGAVVLAMGCRERARGAMGIPGFRQAGVLTAGTAQRLMNIEGFSVGKEIVILGSGDIGLIMARRMTLAGAIVKVVAEIMPYPSGLRRNIVQCLEDFNIPLKVKHTVVRVHGKDRVSGVTLAEVNDRREPIPNTEEFYECDTLLLSCGLIPENELSRKLGLKMDAVTGGAVVKDNLETSLPGIFSCGNVLHVHDLVDYVSKEAAKAGRSAAEFVRKRGEGEEISTTIRVCAGNGIKYVVPQEIRPFDLEEDLSVRFRVDNKYQNKSIAVYCDEVKVKEISTRVLFPGEMKEMVILRSVIEKNINKIVVCLEG